MVVIFVCQKPNAYQNQNQAPDSVLVPLGTEKGWFRWYLLIVDSIRGGKGGSS